MRIVEEHWRPWLCHVHGAVPCVRCAIEKAGGEIRLSVTFPTGAIVTPTFGRSQ